MQPLIKRLNELRPQIQAAIERLRISDKQAEIEELDRLMATSEIWNNPTNAQAKSKELAALRNMVEPWLTLRTQVDDITELMDLDDDSLLGEFEGQIRALE